MSNSQHVQIYVYRLPSKNHDAMVRVMEKFTGMHRKYGTERWEILQLNSTEALEGTTNLAGVVSASKDEEVWVEVDHYKDQKARDWAVSAIMQDPEAGALFGEMAATLTEGYTVIMGEFIPVSP